MSKRHVMQVRPRQGDGPPYSPQRDLAWLYAPAMKEALVALDQVNWTEEMAEIITILGITEEDISEAVGKLTKAHRYMVNRRDVTEPVHALERACWYDVDPGARYLIYGRLGEVMLGGFFIALRDTSEYADESSQAVEIADFIAAGKLVMERGSGKVPTDLEISALSHHCHQLESRLQGCKDALAAAHFQIHTDAEDTVRTIKALAEQNKHLTQQVVTRNEIISVACRMGFWRTLWWGLRKPLMRKLWLTKICGQGENSSS